MKNNIKIYHSSKSGFSMIEISVVILIISILVFGIVRSRHIVTKAKFSTAKSATSLSPVKTIPDLFAWWEPIMEDSFNKQHAINNKTLENINQGSWFDRSGNRNNATDVVGAANNIKYNDNSINNLPAVRFFGGASSGIQFDASNLINKDFTIFVVEQRLTSSILEHPHISWGGAINLGYINQTNIAIIPTTTPSSNIIVPAYLNNPQPRIITYMLSSSILPFTQGVFVNGGNGTIASSTTISQTVTFTNNIGYIGRNDAGNRMFAGDIAEIIIYTRALDISQRNEIQKYLGKKYDIKITPTTI